MKLTIFKFPFIYIKKISNYCQYLLSKNVNSLFVYKKLEFKFYTLNITVSLDIGSGLRTVNLSFWFEFGQYVFNAKFSSPKQNDIKL